MAPIRYERVTLDTGQIIVIQITGESATFLKGYEVDHNGDEISGRKFDRRLWMIHIPGIVKRVPLVMDNKYGTLKKKKG